MSDTTPTPRTEDRINRISIENEDSCCSIYVKIDGTESDCDLIDADFARQLERELSEKHEENCVLKSQVENNDAMLDQAKMNSKSMWKTKVESAESRIAALENELAELRASTAWRPISQAPKDGSEILLFEKYGTAPFVGYWSPRIGRWEASTEHYSVNGDACIFTSCLQSDILHFMPLPKPPTL